MYTVLMWSSSPKNFLKYNNYSYNFQLLFNFFNIYFTLFCIIVNFKTFLYFLADLFCGASVVFHYDVCGCFIFLSSGLHQLFYVLGIHVFFQEGTVVAALYPLVNGLRGGGKKHNGSVLLHFLYVALAHYGTAAAGNYNVVHVGDSLHKLCLQIAESFLAFLRKNIRNAHSLFLDDLLVHLYFLKAAQLVQAV